MLAVFRLPMVWPPAPVDCIRILPTMSEGRFLYFVSDVHLGVPDHASSLEREKRLVAWLDHIAASAKAIHIVGDLFDFWFEWKEVVPRGYVRLLGKLAELRDQGIDVQLYSGNHDIWYFGYFEREFGIPVHKAPQRFAFGEKRFVVGHGDGIGPGDHGYKFIKAVFANRLCQWLFARLHPNLAVTLALFWSRKSRQADADIDESFQFEQERQVIWSREQQAEAPADYYIYGHRHCPTRYPLDERALFVNLGDWISHFSFARFDGEALELLHWDGAAVRPMPQADQAGRSPEDTALERNRPHGSGSAVQSASSGTDVPFNKTLQVLVFAMGLMSTLFLGSGMASCKAQSAAQTVRPVADPESGTDQTLKAGQSTAPAFDAPLLWRAAGAFAHIAPDGLGNVYAVTESGDVRRYGENGQLLYRISEVRFGSVGGLDAVNPLRILVYYPEYLTALLLSNTLGISAELDLQQLGFLRVRAVGLARDGRLWLYDEANFQLIKLDDRGQVQRRSEPLNYILSTELKPVRLVERNERLYLHDPEQGILVFDAFGTYEYRFGGPGIRRFQVFPDRVVYEDAAGKGILHDVRSGFETPFALPGEPASRRDWRLDRDRILMLDERGLSVFGPIR